MESNSDRTNDSVRCRTRSQAAPEWTMNSLLILVNEIAAVEGDCQSALSSFQKWKIISENCSALDVARNVNQCRRRWNSLLSEYKKIDQCESQTGVGSYWSLGSEKRKQLGLPESFDNELYNAIGNLVKARDDQLDSDPEGDMEGEVDAVEFTGGSGSKRGKRLLVPPKGCQREKSKRVSMEETPNITLAELIPKKRNVKKPDRKFIEKKQHMNHAKEKPNSSCIEVMPQIEEAQEDCVEVEPHIEMVREDFVEVEAHNVRVQEDCVDARPQNESVQEDCVEVGPQNQSVQQDCVDVGPQNQSVQQDCVEAGPRNQSVQQDCVDVEPQNQGVEEKCVEMGPRIQGVEENCVDVETQYQSVQEDLREEKEEVTLEDNKEEMMAARIRASAEMIHAIVHGNLPVTGDDGPSDLKNINDRHTVFIRRQGDKLISCLEDIVNSLSQLGDRVQD